MRLFGTYFCLCLHSFSPHVDSQCWRCMITHDIDKTEITPSSCALRCYTQLPTMLCHVAGRHEAYSCSTHAACCAASPWPLQLMMAAEAANRGRPDSTITTCCVAKHFLMFVQPVSLHGKQYWATGQGKSPGQGSNESKGRYAACITLSVSINSA